MTEKVYRATITYRKLRPYWSPYYNRHIINKDYDAEQGDLEEVGHFFKLVVGPYDSMKTLKGQIGRAKKTHPLGNKPWTYQGDHDPSTEIVSIYFEQGTYKVEWTELDHG